MCMFHALLKTLLTTLEKLVVLNSPRWCAMSGPTSCVHCSWLLFLGVSLIWCTGRQGLWPLSEGKPMNHVQLSMFTRSMISKPSGDNWSLVLLAINMNHGISLANGCHLYKCWFIAVEPFNRQPNKTCWNWFVFRIALCSKCHTMAVTGFYSTRHPCMVKHAVWLNPIIE